MKNPLWALATGFALLGTAVVAGAIIVWRGGEEEFLQQPATASASPASSTTPAPSPSAPPTAAATPSATGAPSTPAPVPQGWLTYSDPGGKFSVSYPPNWYLDDQGAKVIPDYLLIHFYTYEPGSIAPGSKFPKEAIKIDLYTFRREAGREPDCAAPAPAESTPISADGVGGWRKTMNYEANYEESEDGITYADQLLFFSNGYCLHMIAYFAQDERGNDATFDRLVSTIDFTE